MCVFVCVPKCWYQSKVSHVCVWYICVCVYMHPHTGIDVS